MGAATLQVALADGAWRRACTDVDGLTTVPQCYWNDGPPGKRRTENATKIIRDDIDAHPDALTLRNRALVWEPT